jgi:REP element-mobilizing transposase RayT
VLPSVVDDFLLASFKLSAKSRWVKQLALGLKTWGGKRKGAGRRPNGSKAGVSHLRRPAIAARHPVHVTLRVRAGVGYLRAWQRAQILQDAFREARIRFGMRIVHYSIQGNHLHLIVEVESAEALSRGMQGLAIRIARRLNALVGRCGTVFADRYHAHALRSRREVANAVRYVLNNYRKHTLEHVRPHWDDPFSSTNDAPVAAPRTWLLRVGWRV